jgi:hypothetical protein
MATHIIIIVIIMPEFQSDAFSSMKIAGPVHTLYTQKLHLIYYCRNSTAIFQQFGNIYTFFLSRHQNINHCRLSKDLDQIYHKCVFLRET